jgi:hypothetical protein
MPSLIDRELTKFALESAPASARTGPDQCPASDGRVGSLKVTEGIGAPGPDQVVSGRSLADCAVGTGDGGGRGRLGAAGCLE